jgi:hypothetical protein
MQDEMHDRLRDEVTSGQIASKWVSTAATWSYHPYLTIHDFNDVYENDFDIGGGD